MQRSLIAVRNGHFHIVEWLLQNVASLAEVAIYENTALLLAVYNGHLSLVEWLLKPGATVIKLAARP